MATIIQFNYTLGYIRCPENNRILLLNRNKKPWMGLYYGIIGETKPNESPLECMIRETNEQTGLSLTNFTQRGVMTWDINYTDDSTSQHYPSVGGLYLFTADISAEQLENYHTPMVYSDEGILDWKNWNWIMHQDNFGIVDNVKIILQYLFESKQEDLFTVKYDDRKLTNCVYLPGQNPLLGKQ
ncbi:hypothetical protein SBY92_005185 [Candida maltosa Xu316]